MGCNTSKESVQPAPEEAKEDAENGGKCTKCTGVFRRHANFPAIDFPGRVLLYVGYGAGFN